MRRSDIYWCALMVVAIMVGLLMPRPLAVFQAAICGMSIGIKIGKTKRV